MSAMIGQTIGKYEVEQVVGQGGMATVYKAYQPDMERHVAIKLLPRRLSEDSTFLRRFQREARTIANLEHRSILPVYDYGEHDNQPYIVMRYISTGTLRKKMYYEDISVEKAADIIEQVAEALDYAHSKNVIHRDMKPSNILLDAQDNAYLTDFGIAKMLGGSTSYMTDGSGVIGTPSYMSPEQCQGKDLGPPTDLYALGAILYEILTGAPPYIADTPLTVMYMHVRDPIPKATLENPSLPPGVNTVFRRILAKRPAERYESATTFAQDFRRTISGALDKQPTPASSDVRRPNPADMALPPTEPTPLSKQFDPVSSADYRPVIMPRGEIEAIEGDIVFSPEDEVPSSLLDQEAYPSAPAAVGTSFADEQPHASKQPAERTGISVIIASIFGITAIIGAVGLGVLFFSSVNDVNGIALAPTLPSSEAEPTTFIVVVVTGSPTATDVGSIITPTTEGETGPLPSTLPSETPSETPTSGLPPTATATLRPTGTPILTATPTLTQTPTPTPTATEAETASPASGIGGRGQLAFTEGSSTLAEIVVIDVDGSNREQLTDNDYYDAEPDWSPSGSQLVFESRPGNNIDLYIASANGSNRRQLTNSSEDDRHPSWAPDGDVIVFESGTGDDTELYSINADGSDLTRLTNNDYADRVPQFSSNGNQIAYMTNQRGGWEIAILSYPDGEQLNIFNCPAQDCRFPSWSPDDDKIAFNTLDSTRRVEDKIWLLDISDGASSLLISGDNNGRAAWSNDGYIYFNRTPENTLNTLLYQYDLEEEAVQAILDSSRPTSYGPDWAP